MTTRQAPRNLIRAPKTGWVAERAGTWRAKVPTAQALPGWAGRKWPEVALGGGLKGRGPGAVAGLSEIVKYQAGPGERSAARGCE